MRTEMCSGCRREYFDMEYSPLLLTGSARNMICHDCMKIKEFKQTPQYKVAQSCTLAVVSNITPDLHRFNTKLEHFR